MADCGGCEARLSGMANIELLPAVSDEPLACSLEGAELAERAQEFHTAFAWLWSRERLPRGFRWTFLNGPGVERRIRELARREHVCCPFLSFAVSTHGEHVIWEGHGPADAPELIEEFFALSDASEELALAQRARGSAIGTN